MYPQEEIDACIMISNIITDTKALHELTEKIADAIEGHRKGDVVRALVVSLVVLTYDNPLGEDLVQAFIAQDFKKLREAEAAKPPKA